MPGHIKSIFRRPSLSFLSKQYWRKYGWKLVGYQQWLSAMDQDGELKLDLKIVTKEMFMKKIYDIFIGKNFSLPNNFLIPNYDTFLFFDFGLGMEPEFLEYFSDLLDLGGFNKQVNVFDYDFNIIVDNWILEHDNLIKNIQRISGSMNDYGNSGVIMADTDLNWVAVQDIPINWGVFAFQSSKKESIRLFHMMDRDWFVDIERFKAMDKSLIREFGEEFINVLLSNYSNIRSKP